MTHPQLGEWREICAHVVKGKDHATTIWQRVSIAPIRAMFIGQRVVHEGYTETEFEFDGSSTYSWKEFRHERSLCVWLFVTSPYRKPMFVLQEDATPDNTPPARTENGAQR